MCWVMCTITYSAVLLLRPLHVPAEPDRAEAVLADIRQKLRFDRSFGKSEIGSQWCRCNALELQCGFESATQYASEFRMRWIKRRMMFFYDTPYNTVVQASNEPTAVQAITLVSSAVMADRLCRIARRWLTRVRLTSFTCLSTLKGGFQVWRRVAWRDRPAERRSLRHWPCYTSSRNDENVAEYRQGHKHIGWDRLRDSRYDSSRRAGWWDSLQDGGFDSGSWMGKDEGNVVSHQHTAAQGLRSRL